MSSKNIFGLRHPSNKSTVEAIRRKFLLSADSNPQLYDPIDVDRCRSEDWQIERYLIEKGSPEQAFKALAKTMVWKKAVGVHDRSRNYFPKEMVRIFGQQKASRDKEGTFCLWSNTPLFERCQEFDQLFIEYTLYNYECADREAGNEGFISLVDWKGYSYSNFDTKMAEFNLAFFDHYPQVMKLSCTFDMPWFLAPVSKAIISVLPKNIVTNVEILKKNNLKKYVDIDVNDIPVSFGGQRPLLYFDSDDMLPLSQCTHLGFTDKQIEKFYEMFKQCQI